MTVTDQIQATLDALSSRDRRILLIAALSLSASTSELAAAVGLSKSDLLRTGAADLLNISPSRYAFCDPQVDAAVRFLATSAQIADGHTALAHACDTEGHAEYAAWHQVMAGHEPSPDDARSLVALAGELLQRGKAARAYEVGRLAAEAPGIDARQIALLMARAALHAGYLTAASAWLNRTGHAEPSAATVQLIRWNVATAPGHAGAPRMQEGFTDLRSQRSQAPDPPTPVVRARDVVGRALTMLADGQVAAGRRLLLRAAYWLPIAIPSGGVGVVLARRLDLAVMGEVGATARALERTGPHRESHELRMAELTDRAIEAVLAGRFDRALIALDLERQRNGESAPLPVRGLNELEGWMLAGCCADGRRDRLLTQGEATDGVEPDPRLSWARLACASDDEVPSQLRTARAQLSAIRSPYERAHAELCAAAVWRARGKSAAGRDHILAASSEFVEAGALAWRDFAEGQLRALSPDRPIAPGHVGPDRPAEQVQGAGDDWKSLLSQREAQVVSLVSVGASNREVARQLGISERTIEVHLSRIYRKLGVQGRVELAILAHRVAT